MEKNNLSGDAGKNFSICMFASDKNDMKSQCSAAAVI